MQYIVGGALPAAYCVVTIGGNIVLSTFSTHSKNYSITNMNVSQIDLHSIEYTVNIQYNPSTFEAGNANLLEYKIKDFLKTDKTVTIVFGYESNSPYSYQVSPIYIGHMIDFSTQVNRNYIDYTLKGVGKIADGYNSMIDGKLTFDYKTNIKKFVESLNNNDALPEVYRKHFTFKCDPNLGAIIDFFGPNVIIPQNIPAQAGSTAVNIAFSHLYEITDPCTGERKFLNGVSTFSVMSFLRCLVNKINLFCNSSEIKDSKMKNFYNHQFTVACDFYSTGAGKYGTISIVDVMDDTNQNPTTYDFDYGHVNAGDSPNNHLVLGWSCTFNDIAVFYSKEELDNGNIRNEFVTGMETNGATTMAKGKSAHTSTDSNNSSSINTVQNENNISAKLAEAKETFYYPYEGTLSIIGNPEPIEICRKVINITPRINNSPHHTAGKYLVTGVTHNIDSSAFFTTEYKVIKVNKDFVANKDASNNLIAQSKEIPNYIAASREPTQKDISG